MKITSRPGRFLLSLLLLALSLVATAAERTVYFVNDAQGSPVAAMDQQGEVLWRESYAPYGERRTKAADNSGKPAYTGKPEDADTSLVYMHARMYDPETARFTGIDPQGFKEDFPQSFGRYLYANNAPYVYVDPDGELPFLIPVAVFIAKEGAGVAFEAATGVPAIFSIRGLAKAASKGVEKSARNESIRQRVLANIGESKAARKASNFEKHNEWPPNDGFTPGTSERYTLWPGQLVDRYGSIQGKFAAEYGTPYRARALKPGSDGKPYHAYEVTQPIEVTAGSSRSWFGYEGGGSQYKFDQSIRTLLDRGMLREKK